MFTMAWHQWLISIDTPIPQIPRVTTFLWWSPRPAPRIRGLAEERGYVADYTQPSEQLRYKYLISTEPSTDGEMAGLENMDQAQCI